MKLLIFSVCKCSDSVNRMGRELVIHWSHFLKRKGSKGSAPFLASWKTNLHFLAPKYHPSLIL